MIKLDKYYLSTQPFISANIFIQNTIWIQQYCTDGRNPNYSIN